MNRMSAVRIIAPHEAGHGIMAYRFGYPIEEIILFVDERHPHGYVNLGDPNIKMSSFERVVESVLIDVAGSVAEYLVTGRKRWWRYMADYQNAETSLSWVCEFKDQVTTRISFFWTYALHILSRPENMYLLKCLTDAIKSSLQEPEISHKYESEPYDPDDDNFYFYDDGKNEDTFFLEGSEATLCLDQALKRYREDITLGREISSPRQENCLKIL